MNDFFTATILIATVASGIRLATPFLLASLGEALGQRSGVLNLGVDGVMLMGAFTAYFIILKTGNPILGAAAGTAGLLRRQTGRPPVAARGHSFAIMSATTAHPSTVTPEIEKARQAYNEQVPAAVRAQSDYFHQELIKTLAGGDAALLGNLA